MASFHSNGPATISFNGQYLGIATSVTVIDNAAPLSISQDWRTFYRTLASLS